jgi:hypothetical protein
LSKGNRLPFPPSGRVRIIGEEPQGPPAGRYYYEVPAMIRYPGEPLDADSFEFWFPMPLEGIRYKTLSKSILAELQRLEPGKPAPKVVPLAPFFLGFIPQEELDRRAEEEKKLTVIQ